MPTNSNIIIPLVAPERAIDRAIAEQVQEFYEQAPVRQETIDLINTHLEALQHWKTLDQPFVCIQRMRRAAVWINIGGTLIFSGAIPALMYLLFALGKH